MKWVGLSFLKFRGGVWSSVAGDGTIRIWDVTDGRQQQIGHLKGHEGPVWKAKISSGGRLKTYTVIYCTYTVHILYILLQKEWSFISHPSYLTIAK